MIDMLCDTFDSQWNWIELREIPGKGRGFVASKALAVGTVVLSENVFCRCMEDADNVHVECVQWSRSIIDRYGNIGERFLLDFLHVTNSFDETFRIDPAVDACCEELAYAGEDDEMRIVPLRRAGAAVRSNAFEKGDWFYLPIFGTLFNHACQPNAEISCDLSNGRAHVHLRRAVAAGEEVCISYIDQGLPLHVRRAQLHCIWDFECRCNQCMTDSAVQ